MSRQLSMGKRALYFFDVAIYKKVQNITSLVLLMIADSMNKMQESSERYRIINTFHYSLYIFSKLKGINM